MLHLYPENGSGTPDRALDLGSAPRSVRHGSKNAKLEPSWWRGGTEGSLLGIPHQTSNQSKNFIVRVMDNLIRGFEGARVHMARSSRGSSCANFPLSRSCSRNILRRFRGGKGTITINIIIVPLEEDGRLSRDTWRGNLPKQGKIVQ